MIAPADLDRGTLVALAQARTPVRLRTGRTGRLVSWGCSAGKNYARVEFPSGNRASVRVDMIEAVLIEVPG